MNATTNKKETIDAVTGLPANVEPTSEEKQSAKVAAMFTALQKNIATLLVCPLAKLTKEAIRKQVQALATFESANKTFDTAKIVELKNNIAKAEKRFAEKEKAPSKVEAPTLELSDLDKSQLDSLRSGLVEKVGNALISHVTELLAAANIKNPLSFGQWKKAQKMHSLLGVKFEPISFALKVSKGKINKTLLDTWEQAETK